MTAYAIAEMIETMVEGNQRTDDKNKPSQQLIFDHFVNAYYHLLHEQAVNYIKTFGPLSRNGFTKTALYDPALLIDKAYDIETLDSGQRGVKLISPPLALPYTMGVYEAYIITPLGCQQDLPIVQPSRLAFVCKVPFASPCGAIVGNTFRIAGLPLLKKINLVTLDSALRLNNDGNETFDVNKDLPLKQDLIQPSIMLAYQTLLGETRIPQDVSNDNNDQAQQA
jgi:hypothetical protein